MQRRAEKTQSWQAPCCRQRNPDCSEFFSPRKSRQPQLESGHTLLEESRVACREMRLLGETFCRALL